MADDQQGIPGRLMIVAIAVLSVVTVVAGLAIIRPPEGHVPVPAADRPFGPATQEDFEKRPLIDKGIAKERQSENAQRRADDE